MIDRHLPSSITDLQNTLIEVQTAKPVVVFKANTDREMIELGHCQAIAAALGCQIDWRSSAEDQTAPCKEHERLLPENPFFAASTDRAEHVLLDRQDNARDTLDDAIVFNIFAAPRRAQSLDVILACPVAGTAAALERHNASIKAQLIKTAAAHNRRKICVFRDNGAFDKIGLVSRSFETEAVNADCDIETISEEEGFTALLRNPNRWDMIICRPSIRRLLSALFMDRANLGEGVQFGILSSEFKVFGVEKQTKTSKSASTILAQIYALGALLAGLGMNHAARQLDTALRDVLERGITLEGLFDTTPYATVLSTEEFTQAVLDAIADQAPRTGQTSMHGQQTQQIFVPNSRLALVQ